MNVSGKTVFITGSTDGVGRYVALQLASQGANLSIHGRDAERGSAVVDEIKRSGRGTAKFYPADLASLADVRRLADAVIGDHDKVDIFISNAGIGSRNYGPERRVSADGHELRFAVNYLSGFLLAYRLLPIIKAAAPARIVNVSSLGQAPLDFDDVMLTRGYDGTRAYAQSKLSQIMFTVDLAEELKGTGVTVNTLHPATYMNTTMVLAGGRRRCRRWKKAAPRSRISPSATTWKGAAGCSSTACTNSAPTRRRMTPRLAGNCGR